MTQPLCKLSEHLYRFEDTCNVYLLADGDAGLLVDAGSGAVLDHVHEAGVRRIEWVADSESSRVRWYPAV